MLVISDNPILCEWLKIEFDRLCVNETTKVSWYFSHSNPDPHEMIALGAVSLNVKDQSNIERIIRDYDLVLSIHCRQIFPAELVDKVSCINIHPGYNPHNRGWFPQIFAILNGLPVGATIHVMDAAIDHGPIIDQLQVKIDPGDTSLEVYQKVLLLEKTLLAKNIESILQMNFTTQRPSGTGNLNTLADFKALCKLDLNRKGSLGEHLTLLRALSHGEFRNAYFDENGRKYFVRILIEPEMGQL